MFVNVLLCVLVTLAARCGSEDTQYYEDADNVHCAITPAALARDTATVVNMTCPTPLAIFAIEFARSVRP